MKIENKPYTVTEDTTGFYGSKLKQGTTVYPLYTSDKPIKSNGKYWCRFVFDTIKGSKAHGIDGNKRIAVWAVNGKLEGIVK